MTRTKSLSFLLVSLLPFGALAPACSSPNTSSKGQLIECATDPATGVVLSCKPTDSTTTSGANTCLDVDEDGDGEPEDSADSADGADDAAFALTGRPDGGDQSEADDDADGVPDSEDCDHHAGEDDDGDDSLADLPYDIQLAKGQTTTPIVDAFAKEGPQPAAIVSVTGATWRSTELAAGTPFVVTDADCTHLGTADVGRDRVVVTWKDPDGSLHSDHLDLRYCP